MWVSFKVLKARDMSWSARSPSSSNATSTVTPTTVAGKNKEKKNRRACVLPTLLSLGRNATREVDSSTKQIASRPVPFCFHVFVPPHLAFLYIILFLFYQFLLAIILWIIFPPIPSNTTPTQIISIILIVAQLLAVLDSRTTRWLLSIIKVSVLIKNSQVTIDSFYCHRCVWVLQYDKE